MVCIWGILSQHLTYLYSLPTLVTLVPIIQKLEQNTSNMSPIPEFPSFIKDQNIYLICIHLIKKEEEDPSFSSIATQSPPAPGLNMQTHLYSVDRALEISTLIVP